MKRAFAMAVISISLTACRLLSGEVACERDRDCPGSLRFCDVLVDGGEGLCVEEDPTPPVDAGQIDFTFDAGVPDGGPPPDAQ